MPNIITIKYLWSEKEPWEAYYGFNSEMTSNRFMTFTEAKEWLEGELNIKLDKAPTAKETE